MIKTEVNDVFEPRSSMSCFATRALNCWRTDGKYDDIADNISILFQLNQKRLFLLETQKKNFRLQISGFKFFFCSVRSFLDPGVSERERIIEFKVGVLQKKLWNSCRWLHGESFYNSVSALEIYYRPNLPYILSPNGSLASFCTSCLREANIYLICTSFWACLLEKVNLVP